MIRVTSPQTISYNCLAWALRDTKHWWSPEEDYYWPDMIPRENTVDCYAEVFALFGYERCRDVNFEEGYCKIAIFANSEDKPVHVVRQIKNGIWTSKLGSLADIEHDLQNDLKADPILSSYGRIAVIMKRKKV